MKHKKLTPTLPTWTSVTHAAGALNVSPEKLRALKKRGCDAFTGSGRVDGTKLVRWLVTRGNEHDAPDLDAARAKLADARRALLEREAKLSDGELLDASAVLEGIEGLVADIATMAQAQVPDYLLEVQAVTVVDRAELAKVRGGQAAVLAVGLRQAADALKQKIGRTPAGEENLIGRFDRMQKEIRKSMDAHWAQLHSAVPPEHCAAVDAWFAGVAADAVKGMP